MQTISSGSSNKSRVSLPNLDQKVNAQLTLTAITGNDHLQQPLATIVSRIDALVLQLFQKLLLKNDSLAEIEIQIIQIHISHRVRLTLKRPERNNNIYFIQIA